MFPHGFFRYIRRDYSSHSKALSFPTMIVPWIISLGPTGLPVGSAKLLTLELIASWVFWPRHGLKYFDHLSPTLATIERSALLHKLLPTGKTHRDG